MVQNGRIWEDEWADYHQMISKAALKRLRESGYRIVPNDDIQRLETAFANSQNENFLKDKALDKSNVAIVQSVARINDLKDEISSLKRQLQTNNESSPNATV